MFTAKAVKTKLQIIFRNCYFRRYSGSAPLSTDSVFLFITSFVGYLTKIELSGNKNIVFQFITIKDSCFSSLLLTVLYLQFFNITMVEFI